MSVNLGDRCIAVVEVSLQLTDGHSVLERESGKGVAEVVGVVLRKTCSGQILLAPVRESIWMATKERVPYFAIKSLRWMVIIINGYLVWSEKGPNRGEA